MMRRHEWRPINASEQECSRCMRGRAIPDDCLDCRDTADCYAAGHGGAECTVTDAERRADRVAAYINANGSTTGYPAADDDECADCGRADHYRA
jgi:hypothetical protein